MKRSTLLFSVAAPIGAAVFGLAEFLPLVSHAASLGPIVSDACYCNGTSAPGWGCILGTFQNAINFLVGFATVIITLFIAWAGFTYMTSGGSPEQRSLANRRILNAVIGLVIALASYLLVNSLLNVLYNPNAGFGSWNSILGGIPAEDCLAVHNPPNGLPALNNSANATGGSGSSSGATIPASGSGACSGSAVQQAAAADGDNISNSEAATLACIAGPESGCGALNKNYNWDGAKSSPPSTAWGPFQITLKGNSNCFNNSACEQAAGVSGPLNCNQAFNSQGYSIPGQLLTECQTAAANLGCSAVAADCIVQESHGSYSAWTNNADSTAAHQACVANNGGG